MILVLEQVIVIVTTATVATVVVIVVVVVVVVAAAAVVVEVIFFGDCAAFALLGLIILNAKGLLECNIFDFIAIFEEESAAGGDDADNDDIGFKVNERSKLKLINSESMWSRDSFKI